LGIVLRAKDLASRTIAGVNKQLGNIGSNVSRGLGNAVRNVERGIAAIGAAAVAGVGFSLKVAGDFEAQLNTINTVAKLTPEVLGEIGEGIRKLARDTGTSHADLTSAYYDLVSAGIKAADAQNVLTAANTLAIGGLSTTAEAVDLLTTAINSYGGDASKAGVYADQFAQAIAAGKVTAAELAASFAQVGPQAASMGVGVDEISASIGVMTAKGTGASEAFTQISAAMTALQRQTPEMTRVLEELGIADAELYADTYGLAPLYEKLAKKAEELGIPLIKLTGRLEGSQYALQNTGPAFALYEAGLDAVRNSSGEAADQMSERQQGFNYQLARIKTLAHDAAITIGDRLLPKIVPLMEKVAQWADLNQEGIGKFAEDLANGVERAAKWASSFDWSTIASTMKVVAGVTRTILETFLKMPSWVQIAVVSGWGLNKLTGGALGSLLGQALTGGAKGLLGGLRGATAATPMFTKEVGLGGAGGAAGAGGRGGGLFGNVLKGLGVLAAAQMASEVDEWLGQDLKPNDLEWPFGPKNTPAILPEIFGGNGLLGGTAIETGGTGGGSSAGGGGGSGSFGGSGGVGGGTARGGGGAVDPVIGRLGSALEKLSTGEFLTNLARTTEMGLAGIGTSIEVGVTRGMDPLGDHFTRLAGQLENPKDPPALVEISNHIIGLEEIQAAYLASGDVKLAGKVQTNIDTLHTLIGTTDKVREVTAYLAEQARSSDAAMLQTAQRHTAQNDSLVVTQAEALAAVRATNATLATKNFSTIVKVNVNNAVTFPMGEYQQRAASYEYATGLHKI